MNQDQTQILRIIDANLNRSREGIRVVEDCARFVLNDKLITQQCKSLRHQLRDAVSTLGFSSLDLITSRDTLHDVGTSISTSNESDRSAGMTDIVQAACKRVTEALRVIEETSKTLGSTGSRFESIRYAMYTIEQQTILALSPKCPQWVLCVLISQSLCIEHSPCEVMKRAAAGGADCIQIREKHMPDDQLLDHAGQLTELGQSLGIDVIINDRVDIAKLVQAQGVHLGQGDLPTSDAREILGYQRWIGRTCPTIDEATRAIANGADNCGIGPIFESTTKSKPILGGLDLIKSYLSTPTTQKTPVLAISGINPDNIDELAELNCPGVAVSSAVCSAANPESVCSAIVSKLSAQHGTIEPTLNA